jgi:hypothetical protein
MLGTMPPEQGLQLARAQGLELVELSSSAQPPRCKLLHLNYGKQELGRIFAEDSSAKDAEQGSGRREDASRPRKLPGTWDASGGAIGCHVVMLAILVGFLLMFTVGGGVLALLGWALVAPLALGFVAYIVWLVRGRMNPRLSVAVNRARLRGGDTLVVDWQLIGGFREPSSLKLLLNGSTHLTERGSENDSHRRSTFFERTLIDKSSPVRGERGRLTTIIPSAAMHSVTFLDGGVEWKLVARIKATGESEGEFPFVVEPDFVAEGEAYQLVEAPVTPTSLDLAVKPAPSCVRLSRTSFRPGELVEGSIDLDCLRSRTDTMASVHVQLWWIWIWDRKARVVAEQVLPADPERREIPFALRLPDRPYSFEDAIRWVVVVPALLGSTTITVSPEGPTS